MSQPGRNKGIKNIKAILNEHQVKKIYQNKTTKQKELANMYGVSQSTINHIKTGRTWRWLTKDL